MTKPKFQDVKDSIDWAVLSDQQIADRIGVCRATVSAWRVKYGLPKFAAPEVPLDVDWSLSDGKIAKGLKTTEYAVRKARKERGVKPRTPRQRNPIQDQISEEEWATLGDLVLANKYGSSKGKIRRWRRRRNGRPDKNRTPPSLSGRKYLLLSLDCSICGYKKVAGLLHVHHIKPRAEGGTNANSNLVRLCPNCHGEAHAGLISEAELRAVCVEALLEKQQAQRVGPPCSVNTE